MIEKAYVDLAMNQIPKPSNKLFENELWSSGKNKKKNIWWINTTKWWCDLQKRKECLIIHLFKKYKLHFNNTQYSRYRWMNEPCFPD